MSAANPNRRGFLALTAGTGVLATVAGGAGLAQVPSAPQNTPITAAAAITKEERNKRLGRAQALMRAQGIAALLVEPGSTLQYFTGVKWSRSERLTAALLPAEGPICMVTPFFEEPRVVEMLQVPGEVRVWQEDEDPSLLIAGWLKDKKLASGRIAIEETVRYFAVFGLQRALPGVQVVSGTPVVNGCRIIKTPAEIALMQRASDITIAAYRAIGQKIEKGMRGADIMALMNAATISFGAEASSGGATVDKATAAPHGLKEPQLVKDGSVILMDCGCTVDGYHSDISRTFIYGEPSKAQRKMWLDIHRGQEIALAAAQLGTPCGKVDDAVRAYYESIGYGPGYKLPGLPHRTGHGIGLDVHEPVNLVHGEPTPLEAGMCFSNEPGLYAPGSFGVRLEDCFHMTPSGPRFFSAPPPSIDNPFG
jgi:Xaa-Pro aminopeptidase